MLDYCASLIVRARHLIVALAALCAVFFGALIPFVGVNADMAKYLPSASPMRAGTEVLTDQFDDPELSTFRVMVDGLADDSERKEALAALEKLNGAHHVTSSTNATPADGAPARYINGDHTLFVVSSESDYADPAATSLAEELSALSESGLNGHSLTFTSDNPSTSGELPLWIAAIAVALLAAILIAMSASWIEPLLYLATIGIAVLLNMGSNVFLGEIAEVTFSIAAILQLVLSMDYSIILANRYRQERAAQKSRGVDSVPDASAIAMRRALPKAFSAIASASITTIVGLLMLIFMSFKVGADLGIVLAKGVAISMLTVFTVLPAFLVMCDTVIARTPKPFLSPRLGVLARLEHAARWVVLAVFVAILAGSAFLQSRTETAYTLSTPDRVAEHFAPDNDIVLVYLNSNAEHIHEIADAVKRDPHAISVMGYPTTVGEPLTKGEMKRTLEEFEDSHDSGNAIGNKDGSDGSLALNDTALSMVYFAYHDGQAGTMTLREFVAAAREAENLSQKGELGSFTSGRIGRIEGVDALERALDSGQVPGDVLGREFTPKQLASALKSMKERGSEGDHSGDASDAAPIDEDDLTQLFVLHRALHESDPSWTMSLDNLVHFMLEESGQGRRFEGHLSTEQVSQLESAAADIAGVRTRFVGTEFSRLIIRTDYPKESPETLAFVENLVDLADVKVPGEHFLVGDSAMVYEMREGFGAENVKIALFTAAAIFIIVALTFRSIAVPAILVLLVQVGIFITVSTVGLQGYSVYYLAMLIVQCILMGATIDYAIVLTTYYREARQEHGVRESLARAYDGSIHTILTSGLIMVLVTGVIGFLFSNPTVAQICRTIAIGAFAAIILIVGILPALLAVLDRVVAPKNAAPRA